MLIKLTMNTLEHAEDELKRIGMGADTKDPMNKQMHDNIIQIVKTFSKQGHSGFSAYYALSILKKLLDHKPLSPLTGKKEEWNDVSKMNGSFMLQNKCLSSVFKTKKGVYDINGFIYTDKDGLTYTSRGCSIPVKFPYTPKDPIVLNYHASLKRKKDVN